MKKMRCKSDIGWLLYMSMLAVWVNVSPAMASQDSDMFAANTAYRADDKALSAIPAIDAEAPTAFETASFGLG